jgi:RNA polymerase sigma factor (sigma-70 family)
MSTSLATRTTTLRTADDATPGPVALRDEMRSSAVTCASTVRRMPTPARRRRHDLRQASNGAVLCLARDGDRGAWAELVSRFDLVIRRTARRNGMDASDAADVAQVTWMRLAQHIDDVRDPETIAGWLVTTARRESIRVSMRSSRSIASAQPRREADARHQEPAVDDLMVARHYDGDLEDALARLPLKYRHLLLLLMSEAELSYAEVAEAMDLPVGSIGPMRMRAMQILRNSLGDRRQAS